MGDVLRNVGLIKYIFQTFKEKCVLVTWDSILGAGVLK